MQSGIQTRSSFPPIADYAFLSDCEVGALVAPSGNVEWLCVPQFDAPSVFGAVLDRDAGRFRFAPADVEVPAGRRYLPGSMVLETTWMTKTGWLVVRDALTVGPWHHLDERAFRHSRPPTDHEAEHILLRTARCVHGSVELTVECEPAFAYGLESASWQYTGEGYHNVVATCESQDVSLRLDSDLRIGFEGRRASARTTLREGEVAYVSLSWSEHGGSHSFDDAFERMERTAEFWREWLNHGEFPDHRWRTYLERSAITLKGLSYAPSGALAAAATTSLPRVPGGNRNYDLRYSFMRDAAFTLWGLYTLGFDWEGDDFFYFLADLASDERPLQNMYGVGGETDLEERELEHLSGYDGARPVRVGNAAFEYEQHDVWGALLDAAYLHAQSRDSLPERIWPIVKHQVDLAAEHWREPDRGIWATRGKPHNYVTSKVECWVACDRGARLAELREDFEQARTWQKVADEIRDDVCANGLDSRGVFKKHYDTEELDASVLLIPLVRFLPAEDERVRKTVMTIYEELSEEGFILRQRPELSDEDGGELEGETLVIVSFWMVSALAEIGEEELARDLCERMLAYASSLHLYAEHIDPDTGRHLGNFPHAFTHLALINAVMHVIATEQPQDRSGLAGVRVRSH